MIPRCTRGSQRALLSFSRFGPFTVQDCAKLRAVVKEWLVDMDTTAQSICKGMPSGCTLPEAPLPAPGRPRPVVKNPAEEEWSSILPVIQASPQHMVKVFTQLEQAASFNTTDEALGSQGMFKLVHKRTVPTELLSAMQALNRQFMV